MYKFDGGEGGGGIYLASKVDCTGSARAGFLHAFNHIRSLG